MTAVSDDKKKAYIASVLAVSNMGMITYIEQSLNDPDPYWWSEDATSNVCQLAGHLMESDNHEEVFGQEAEMWLSELKHLTLEEIREQYSYADNARWLDPIIDL